MRAVKDSITTIAACLICTALRATASPVVGPPVYDDAHPGARITLELDKPQYFLGENVLIYYHVENTSDKPFTIDVGGDYRGSERSLRFHVSATDSKGVLQPDPYPNEFDMGGLSTSPSVTKDHDFWLWVPLMRYCRIDHPGVYTIRVSHDLGWSGVWYGSAPKATGAPPEAQISITLVMPSRSQARQVIADMDAMPNTGNTWGFRAKPYPDFATLRYPVYLPLLARRAMDSDEHRFETAVDGIAEIPTRDATRTLARLMQGVALNRATYAADALRRRLPDPASKVAAGYWQTTWDPKLTSGVRRAALTMLASSDRPAMASGAQTLQHLATVADLPVAQEAMERLLSGQTDASSALDPQETARGMLALVDQCLQLGAAPPGHPASLAEKMTYVCFINNVHDASERPADWPSTLDQIFATDNDLLRSLTMEVLQRRAMSEPQMAKTSLPYLPKLLLSDNEYLRDYATFWLQMTPDPSLKPALLAALRSHADTTLFLIPVAPACGARWDVADLLADSMHDSASLQRAFQDFATLTGVSSFSVYGNADSATIASLRQKWLDYLAKHRREIENGAVLSRNDPEVADLYPTAIFQPAPPFAAAAKGD